MVGEGDGGGGGGGRVVGSVGYAVMLSLMFAWIDLGSCVLAGDVCDSPSVRGPTHIDA